VRPVTRSSSTVPGPTSRSTSTRRLLKIL
jgi:hypothetical protein